jgi:predicted MFS family arabinose efflux permease
MNEASILLYDVIALKIVCGFFGGASYAVLDRQSSAKVIVASMFVGVMTAVFFGEAANNAVGKWVGWEGTSYYVAGLCGMVILPAVLAASKKWTATLSSRLDEGKK